MVFPKKKKEKEKNEATRTPLSQLRRLPSIVDLSSVVRTHPALARSPVSIITTFVAQSGHKMTRGCTTERHGTPLHRTYGICSSAPGHPLAGQCRHSICSRGSGHLITRFPIINTLSYRHFCGYDIKFSHLQPVILLKNNHPRPDTLA